jgi:NADPH-dependent 2,4-dienoyl-CoA reductase/sulfur reductase-like enzyme
VLRASERRPGRRDARGVSAPRTGEGSSLNAARRTRELEWLAGSSVHLVAGGGGITGLGVALDAASRGLSVALFERQTSHRGRGVELEAHPWGIR